jgi:hypothetical protein
MIILPDKNIVRTKFLLPISEKTWRTPSLAQPKDQLGNDGIRTIFTIKAKLNDGYVVWNAFFESRDDFDAFLWAMVTKKIKYQRSLWDLPTPAWRPDIGDNLSYDFATDIRISSPVSVNTGYTLPVDFNGANNYVEVIGGGGSGGIRRSSGVRAGTGGGAGGYARVVNFGGSPGATYTYQIGAGAAGVSSASTTGINGNTGGATWFNGATVGASSVGANPGTGGLNSTSTAVLVGGSGGVAVTGTFGFTGGTGGTKTTTSSVACATGGGGAAGPTGNGGNGVSATGDGGFTGGTANGGASGGAGTSGTTATGGSTGNNLIASPATGGGGGGGGCRSQDLNGNTFAGSGGQYGGGGGGNSKISTRSGTIFSGAGVQGVIVVSYDPKSMIFNIPVCI